jgi:transposase
MRIPYSSWLLFIKLFELEVSTRKAGRQTVTSYPTALKAFDTLRRSIVEHLSQQDDLLKGEIEADESYFGGKR